MKKRIHIAAVDHKDNDLFLINLKILSFHLFICGFRIIIKQIKTLRRNGNDEGERRSLNCGSAVLMRPHNGEHLH